MSTEDTNGDGVSEETAAAQLIEDDQGLALVAEDGATVRAAVEHLSAPRRGRDLLGRAVKGALKGTPATAGSAPQIVDATAGLGADSFHLAAMGLSVLMVERVPDIAALLADALARASSGAYGEDARRAVANLSLRDGDASAILVELAAAGRNPAVVYLDPMYPGTKKSALPGKGMALFRALVGADDDAAQLLEVARRVASRRVVVKRPLKAPYLGGQGPTGSLKGSTTRYDLYAPLVAQPDTQVVTPEAGE